MKLSECEKWYFFLLSVSIFVYDEDMFTSLMWERWYSALKGWIDGGDRRYTTELGCSSPIHEISHKFYSVPVQWSESRARRKETGVSSTWMRVDALLREESGSKRQEERVESSFHFPSHSPSSLPADDDKLRRERVRDFYRFHQSRLAWWTARRWWCTEELFTKKLIIAEFSISISSLVVL